MSIQLRTLCLAYMAVLGASGCSRTQGEIPQRTTEVDAGGHRLHMVIVGDTGPTVILESGLGGGVGWEGVRAEAARFSTVVTYDRAGFGLSEPGPRPRTARQIAIELHTALKNAKLPSPFVLVGHSMGGPYIRVFAGMYPEEIAGLVLVDPTQINNYESMEMIESWFAEHHPQDWDAVERYCGQVPESLSDLNWMRGIEAKRMEGYLETISPPQQDALRREWLAQLNALPRRKKATNAPPSVRDEFAAATESFREALVSAPLPAVPIILLAAPGRMSPLQVASTLDPELRLIQQVTERWHLEDYQRWINATPGAKLIIARNCGHVIQHDNPELVIAAIREIVESPIQRKIEIPLP